MAPNPFGMTGFWLIVMIVMLIVEAAAPGLVSIWFAAGALAALIGAAMHADIWVQILLFIGVSTLALLITRPLAKKYINGRAQATNADMILGKECLVTEEINNLAGTGAVSVAGKVWTARTEEDNTVIPKGNLVVVQKIEGVKAIVSEKIVIKF